MTGDKYVKITDNILIKIMKSGTTINLSKGLRMNTSVIDVAERRAEAYIIKLTDIVYQFIAFGKCKIIPRVTRGAMGISSNKEYITFINIEVDIPGLKGLKLKEEDGAKAIRLIALHRIIEEAFGIESRCKYHVENCGKVCSINKEYTRLNRQFIRTSKVTYEDIDTTIDRWNRELKSGRFVIYSFGDTERYIEIDKDRVSEVLRKAEETVMG